MIPASARVAVIGAGPAGLTTARILQLHGIDVTVYDLDASAAARDQGGTLDMHPGTGRHALRAAGLWDAFTTLARPEGEQIRLVSRDGEVLFDAAPPGDGQGNPEIDRGRLRGLLVNSLTPAPSGGATNWSAPNPSATAATDSTSPTAPPPTPTSSWEATEPGPGCAAWWPRCSPGEISNRFA
ncbi:FAD-dependent monooxygenase [Microbispora sp. NPDC088329]|uniref:FAD-dependent oxidoreductase n=1 Tax=Microbispora sp. NPDC088329 TaxID=3154869 RepID=UPI00343F168E